MRNRRPGPFDVNVRDIAHHPGEMRTATLDVPLKEPWGEGLMTFPVGDQIEIDARLESVHEGILVTGTAFGETVGICGRCLIELAETREVEFQELFAYPGDEAAEFVVLDDHVDLEVPVRDALVLSLPFQPVCRPDCPGLDPLTGERLDDQAVVKPQDTVDPRWAALSDFAAKPEDDAADRG